MQYGAITAAQAAGARAETCRWRANELGHHRGVGHADVVRARAALDLAARRAASAQERLYRAQVRYRERIEIAAAASAEPGRGVSTPGERPQAAEMRARAREISFEALYVAYMSVGGHCDEFELDAFIHSLIELPDGELAILGQAVWELTEF